MRSIIPNKDDVKQCYKGHRCKLFKQCEICNNIRQARLADATELASRFSKNATYAVVLPYEQTQSNIKMMRSNIIRSMRKSSDGLFCSVETSQNRALHLNMLILSDDKPSLTVFQRALKNIGSDGSIFSETLTNGKSSPDILTQVRNITAYALKRQSIPTPDQFNGNLITTQGSVKGMKEILQGEAMRRIAPLVALVSMRNTLDKLGLITPDPNKSYPKHTNEILADFARMAKQLEKGKRCYSVRHGMLSEKEFTHYYNYEILDNT